MGESVGNSALDEYLVKLDYLNALRELEVLKTSIKEKTSLVEDEEGSRYVFKTLVIDAPDEHPYTLLEGHTCKFLPQVYIILREDNELKILMEQVEGVTLRNYLKAHGRFSPDEAFQLLAGVAKGAQYLHTHFATPLIHRDIKPNNIVISNSASKLIDFGIARTWKTSVEHDTTYMGTSGYAAPE